MEVLTSTEVDKEVLNNNSLTNSTKTDIKEANSSTPKVVSPRTTTEVVTEVVEVTSPTVAAEVVDSVKITIITTTTTKEATNNNSNQELRFSHPAQSLP